MAWPNLTDRSFLAKFHKICGLKQMTAGGESARQNAGMGVNMIRGRKYQAKHKMFVSYICIPIVILTVISCLFSFVYYRISRERVLAFENAIAENVDSELKNIMDNLLRSSAQYSMTPWVTRLKYMQKTPWLMERNITASDISDYASNLSLTEINDSMVESIYIYYSLGGFGISSIGRVGWKEYVNIYQIECRDTALLSGSRLAQNNQKTISHNASLMKNGKRVSGFFMLQTIPLENSYSGEVNILFFVPYEKICAYIENFMDDGTESFYLTDGSRVVYAKDKENSHFRIGDSVESLKYGGKEYRYCGELGAYTAEYTKYGMDIGIVQILDNSFLERDFSLFAEWLIMGYLVLLILIFLVSSRMTKYSYQPLEHIMNMLVEEDHEGSSINEYQIIEKALEELDSQKKRLEVTVFEQNPLIEQYILHTLLCSNKPQANEVKYVNTMRQYSLYRCLALKRSPESGQYIKEIDTCLAIYPQIHAAFVEEGNYHIWVLSYAEESLMEEITEFLAQTFEDSGYKDAALGVSRVHENILHILSAFNQAVRALEYHFFYPDKKVIRLEEDRIEERDQNCAAFEVPVLQQEKISEAVETLHAQQLFDAYQGILLYNFETRFLHKEAYFAGIHKLNDMILGLFGEKKQGNLIEQIELLEPENFASLESYLQTFRLKTFRLMEQCVAKENPVYYARNQMIRQYVEEHLTDANLSLNETARVMHYTSTYFGKYFKEQFGCTFQKYVATKRIECAIRYLRQKNMNVQEIALKCGFTNDVTFRRTFKMYVGVTPSQFEKEQGDDEVK